MFGFATVQVNKDLNRGLQSQKAKYIKDLPLSAVLQKQQEVMPRVFSSTFQVTILNADTGELCGQREQCTACQDFSQKGVVKEKQGSCKHHSKYRFLRLDDNLSVSSKLEKTCLRPWPLWLWKKSHTRECQALTCKQIMGNIARNLIPTTRLWIREGPRWQIVQIDCFVWIHQIFTQDCRTRVQDKVKILVQREKTENVGLALGLS